MKKRLSLVSILALGVSAVAHASGPLGLASTFNAFIFNQATVNGGGESEGAIAVGGLNLTSGNAFTATNNYNITIKSGSAGTLGSLSNIGLYVNGNVDFENGGQLNNGSNAYVSGNFATTNPYDLNGGGTLYYGGSKSGTVQSGSTSHQNLVSSSYFTQEQSYAELISHQLDNLSANASINMSDPNNWALSISGGAKANTRYVVDINESSLGGNGGNPVTLNISSLLSSDTLIFDVTGGNNSHFGISLNNGFSGYQDKVLWNFGTDTNVTIDNRELEGSVLAPYATVDQSTVIEGTLIANNWSTMNGPEIHSYEFTGNATPEPAPFAALGLGALVVLRRRKKA